jgi:uncharacterized protein
MRITRRGALRTIAGAAAAAGAGVLGYGAFVERRSVVVTRATVPVTALPSALAGLRIGVLSDIHCGSFLGPDMVAHAAGLLQAERPDAVVLAGDFVTWSDKRAIGPCAEALGSLSAPLGVFVVGGNHDPEAILESVFERRGVVVLQDSLTVVRARGEALSIGGVRYWTRKGPEISRIFRGAEGTRILLAHDPRRLTQAANLGIPLVISGHTHGGQVVLPGLGAPAAARFPFPAGVGRLKKSTVFVTRGLGTVVLPVRLNCPPEVAVLTLTSA